MYTAWEYSNTTQFVQMMTLGNDCKVIFASLCFLYGKKLNSIEDLTRVVISYKFHMK